MEKSSRIFIKGLPPTITESDFKKHFASNGSEITETRLFPNRRIGYVGYKTHDDARRAVKYFNKSFVRMSRIGVELARPPVSGKAPTALKEVSQDDTNSKSDILVSRKRSEVTTDKEQDPKLQEFLAVMKPQTRKRAWESEVEGDLQQEDTEATHALPDDGEPEYEDLVPKSKRQKKSDIAQPDMPDDTENADTPDNNTQPLEQMAKDTAEATIEETSAAVSDADWARNKTSRLLGLLDDDEEVEEEEEVDSIAQDPSRDQNETIHNEQDEDTPRPEANSTVDKSQRDSAVAKTAEQVAIDDVRSSMRLFLRNLAYDVKAEDLEVEFSSIPHLEEVGFPSPVTATSRMIANDRDNRLPLMLHGQEYFSRCFSITESPYNFHVKQTLQDIANLEQVHVSVDRKTGKGKGMAYVQFSDPDSAEQAFIERDGQIFQGRILHILPASAKRENKLNDFELSKLPIKKQQEIQRRRQAASTQFNWNTLYMNPDAVISSVASQLGIAKSEVLDPTSSDAAVKQAHAETHIIQETKSFFKSNGVDLDAFKKSRRGDNAILVKNIPFDASRDEIKRLFEEHGEIKRFLMPPSGVIAIIQMNNSAQARNAFGALAYRRIKSSMLFLEKAPADIFTTNISIAPDESDKTVAKTSTSELKIATRVETMLPSTGTATLFVRNLNFTTTSAQLTEAFQSLTGFMNARVKTKIDPKRPGEILSMGFGFLEFQNATNAQAALQAMDGFTLHGHKLQVRASHKGADAAEERRNADRAKREAGKSTKVIIKNLPFEATKKDVRALFSAYGQLRSVRVPKKMDRAARGFAFADFTTPKEAESAMDALRDTHLLGRRLVLDFAAEDPVDAEEEIERMAAKVGDQTNAVAVQQLTGRGRKKFTTRQNDEDEEI